MFVILAFPFFILHTNSHFEHSQSFCPFKMLTGLPCPGCGITKSLVAIYQGEFLKSLQFHIFGILVMALCWIGIGTLTTEIITKKEYFNHILYSKKIAYTLAVILIIYHIVRLSFFIYQNSFSQILQESIWR